MFYLMMHSTHFIYGYMASEKGIGCFIPWNNFPLLFILHPFIELFVVVPVVSQATDHLDICVQVFCL